MSQEDYECKPYSLIKFDNSEFPDDVYPTGVCDLSTTCKDCSGCCFEEDDLTCIYDGVRIPKIELCCSDDDHDLTTSSGCLHQILENSEDCKLCSGSGHVDP